MTGQEYVNLSMKFNDGKSTDRVLQQIDFCERIKGSNIDVGSALHAALGMAGEAGEVLDILKKWIFHEKELDLVHLQKEIGDELWYLALMCHSFGFDFDKTMQMNYEKLSARYPDGCFDVYHANHRAEGDI